MNNFYIRTSPNLNMNLQGSSYSYTNIFNVPNIKSMENINNNIGYTNNQDNSYLIKNNSSFFYVNNDYYNLQNNYNTINNNNYHTNNNIYTNNNKKIIINQIFAKDNQSPSQNLNYIYQNNNLSSNAWVKNGNIFYTPSKLANTKNIVLYNYNSLKYNNSYQNLTNRTINSNQTYNSTQTLTIKNDYNINSNNSASTNTKSNYSINTNNKGNITNTNVQKHISQPDLNKISRIKKLKVPKKTVMKLSYDTEPKDHFDPDEFKMIKRIGQGAYGKIYVVQWIRNNKKYAMKKEPIKTNEIVKRRKEKIKVMNDFITKTNCPGIIKIYGNSVKKEKDVQEYYYYIIMELADKDWEQEISDRKKLNLYYTEKELFTIMSQLISTLALLQKNHITHRDIKPQNILLANGFFKLSDFGEARTLKKTGIIISRVRGTELFMSPILFHGFKQKLSPVGHNTFKSDVFSLGLCFLLAASLSFNSLYSIREINDNKIIEEFLNKYLSKRYSEKIIKIILEMLQVDENLRPDFVTLEKKYFLKTK